MTVNEFIQVELDVFPETKTKNNNNFVFETNATRSSEYEMQQLRT